MLGHTATQHTAAAVYLNEYWTWYLFLPLVAENVSKLLRVCNTAAFSRMCKINSMCKENLPSNNWWREVILFLLLKKISYFIKTWSLHFVLLQ